MGFFSFLLFILLLCWVITLQGKVDSLSVTLKHVCRKINDYEKIAFTAVPTQNLHSQMEDVSVAQTQISEPRIEKPLEEHISEKNEVVQSSVTELKNPEVQVKKSTDAGFDFQKALLGNIFNKIGALAIIIAVIILVKLVSPFIVITPLMKYIFGIVLGMGFVGSGFFLHKRENMKNYSEVLFGTGFATFFITTFCGYSILKLYSSMVAIVIGGVLLLTTYILADKMKTLSMLVIGLIGGYLTPLCTNANSDQIFGFLLFLNAVSAIYTLRSRQFNLINPINITLTMFYVLIAYLMKPQPDIIFPSILWGIYIIYDFLRNKTSIIDNVASWINYAMLTFFSMLMFHDAHQTLGIMFVVTALIYVILAVVSRFAQNLLFKTYEYFALLNLWLFIMFILNDVNSVLSWAIVSLIIAVFVALYKLNYLVPAVIVFGSTAFVGALLAQVGGEYCISAKYLPIVNPRTLVFMVPVISMMFSSLLLKSTWVKASNWLRFMGLSLGYIYMICEINSYLMRIADDNDYINFNRLMIFTMIGFIYSLNAKKIANVSNSLLFNFIGYSIFVLSSLMLFVGSYWYPDMYLPILNLRCVAYILAIITCLMFSKWDKVDFFKCIAVILGFLLCHSESASVPKLYGAGWQYLISLAWVLYSGAITVIGIVKERKYLINTGIVIIILTIARIFLYDLAKVEALYKLVAFLALGIILMLVSYIYTAHRDKK